MAQFTISTEGLDREASGRLYALESYGARLYDMGDERKALDTFKQRDDLARELESSHDVRVYYDGRDVRMLAYEKGAAPTDSPRVTCYGKTETWLDRSNAMAFYAEAMAMCEGCERDRYTNVFLMLGEGCDECDDGRDW